MSIFVHLIGKKMLKSLLFAFDWYLFYSAV